MEFDFWLTVAESAIRGVVAALLVVLVALVRLVIKSRREYMLFSAMARADGNAIGAQALWYMPVVRCDSGSNTTWAYEPTAQVQMKWRTWFRKVLWYSLLYKRSTAEPEGRSGRL